MLERLAGEALVLGDDVFLIGDLETLRLLTQPLRLRLLETLRTGAAPMTVKELAAALGMPPTRLYHHVNLLEERGLIRVAGTRLVSGITEKRYAASAARVGVDRSLLTPAAGDETNRQTLEVLLSVILDEVRSEIIRAVEAGLIDLALSAEDKIGPRRLVLGRKWYRLTNPEVTELEERLFAATEHFAERGVGADTPERPPGDEARLYELLIGFYPAVSPADGGDGDEEPPAAAL